MLEAKRRGHFEVVNQDMRVFKTTVISCYISPYCS
jgi:hypothetical protein